MELSLVCKTCNKRVSIGDLKADKSGSGWICLDCYKGQHPLIYKPQKPQKLRSEPIQPISTKPQKVRYHCSECGYKFYKEEGVSLGKNQKYPGRCPYCNLYSVRQEKDADTILRETINESGLRFNRNTDIIDNI